MPLIAIQTQPMEPDKLSTRQFELFREFIYRHSGIRVDLAKVTLVSNRIRRRLKACQQADFDTYYKFLNSAAGASELEQFLDAVTTNETYFFRTPHHFDWFKGEFLDELVLRPQAGAHSKKLRVWSAACSTGEEAYSIAICVQESAIKLHGWKTTIVGTDISEAVLRDARVGTYKKRSLDEVSESRLRRQFDASADDATYTVRPALREMVEFRRHNLMEPLKLPPFDCIFIRNVLIYFDRASKQVVINNLVNALAPGGYLVVGPSEGIYDMLSPLVKRSTFAYQKS
ncbi:MAG: protein-glutamate O-methyltransferase CheR [Planctomycetota bacterium]|nr:protein-glutamate O-methyltransferase CheR [Planctomycetota bacterium]